MTYERGVSALVILVIYCYKTNYSVLKREEFKLCRFKLSIQGPI